MYLFTMFPHAYRGNAYQEYKDNRNCIRFAFFYANVFYFYCFHFWGLFLRRSKHKTSFNILISIGNLCQVSLINRVPRQPIRLNFPFFVIRWVVKHLRASRRRENYRWSHWRKSNSYQLCHVLLKTQDVELCLAENTVTNF